MALQDTLKAISDPVRREILAMLKDGRKAAGEIAEKFDMTFATVSYHLKLLKKADLIDECREKNFIYYSLNTSVFEEIMVWAAGFMKATAKDEPEEMEPDNNDKDNQKPEVITEKENGESEVK